MKQLVFAGAAAAVLMTVAGCQTAGGPAGSPELKASQNAALSRQKALEARVDANLATQAALSNQAAQLHVDLLAAARDMKSIKDRANQVSVAAETNAAALVALRTELGQQRTALEALEQQAKVEAEQVKKLQEALAKEEKARAAATVAAKAEAEQAAAAERKKVEDVKAALAKEQELRAKDQAVAAEKEKEIAALRKSLAERDQLLRAQTSVKPAAPASTDKPVDASVAKQVADGNTALRKGQIDEAEKQFKAALAASPGMMGARVGLAACRYERGDLAQASDLVTAVLKEDRRHAQALGLQGLICWRRGELDDAEESLDAAIKQDKTDSQFRNYLGIVLYERKKFDPAVASLRKAVELDPQNAEARYNLSVVLAMHPTPQLDEAKVQYDKAVELGSARDEAMEKILAPAKPAEPKK